MMRIGEIAARAGVSVQAVRFYERKGLLVKPRRSENGYRSYEGEALERLRFIQRAQRLGFSLEEIQHLLALRVRRTDQCGSVAARVEAKLQDVRTKMADLKRLERALTRIKGRCDSNERTEACPVLRMLEEPE